MDLLADIVESLELRSQLYFRADFGAPFSVRVPEDRRRIRFHIAGPGRSWVGVPSGESVWYGHGDLVLIPHGSAHVLASGPEQDALPLDELLAERAPEAGVLRHRDGSNRVQLVCGHFEFDETAIHPLIASLPPLIHLPANAERSFAWMPELLDAIEAENSIDAPSNEAVARRLSEILFIQVMRAVVADPEIASNLSGVSRDPQLSRVLRSIHAEPGRDWSLESLARLAGASRSAFTERFRRDVGMPPMRYLTHWRMKQARRLLADRELSVGEVGRRVGYASEAAFNRTFREAVGEPPGRYRRALTSP